MRINDSTTTRNRSNHHPSMILVAEQKRRRELLYSSLLHLLLLFTAVPAALCKNVSLSSSSSATFLVFDNGASEGGVEVTMSRDEFSSGIIKQQQKSSSGVCGLASPGSGGGTTTEDDVCSSASSLDGSSTSSSLWFATEMSSHVNVSQYGKEPGTVIANRAFREDGEEIVRFSQLQPIAHGNNTTPRRVYLVPEDLEFVWPFVEPGHNQTISANVMPPVNAGMPPVVLESLSETPRVFKVYHMFTREESSTLIDNAVKMTGQDALKRSTVGDVDIPDPTRTSYNAWDSDSALARTVISRTFRLTRIVEREGKVDGLQLVRYHPGQGYNTHPDYFEDDPNFDYSDEPDRFNYYPYSGGSNRFATVFLYLTDVEEGGCTIFPKTVPSASSTNSSSLPSETPQEALDMFPNKHSWEYSLTKECYAFHKPDSLIVRPQQGTAALFYSITPDGRIDPYSHHAACPVVRGLKWGSNIWIWNKDREEDREGKWEEDERVLVVQNNLRDQTIYVTWEGEISGTLRPGEEFELGTYEGHRFKAHVREKNDRRRLKKTVLSEYTVSREPYEQVWSINEPPPPQQ